MQNINPLVLKGFQDNSITQIIFTIHIESKVLDFEVIHEQQKQIFSIELQTDWLVNRPEDAIIYLDRKPYSTRPLFSEVQFNFLKDALLLNHSLRSVQSNSIIFNKEQMDFLNQIVVRNNSISQSSSGITLFHYAAINNDLKLVQALTWNAKNIEELEIKCHEDKTPLDYARSNHHILITKFLEYWRNEFIQETLAQSLNWTNTPISEVNRQHIFDSLRMLARIKPEKFNQKLISAAIANYKFPSVVHVKLSSLQDALQIFKASESIRPLMEEAISRYFMEEGFEHFKQLLNGTWETQQWNTELMRFLAGNEIIINQNPYVEATIKDGKVYWGVVIGNYMYYRRPHHENIILDARRENRTWYQTWEEFRKFKDSGKRSGTVQVTEERFVNEFTPIIDNNQLLAQRIWQELCKIGILDKKHRISQAWYPFSNENIILPSLQVNNKMAVALYPKIADTLKCMTNNEAYKETIIDNLFIYRPAMFSKNWFGTGKVTNNKKSEITTRVWDVGVARELRDHTPPGQSCIKDHIPSKSQIKMFCEEKILQINQTIQTYQQNNLHELRDKPQEIEILSQERNYWTEQLDAFKHDKDGLSYWCIYITKELDNTGDTTRTSKKEQQSLSFFTSVKKHLDDLKIELDRNTISSNQYLQALGAFRYMYSRLCKKIANIQSTNFINEISFGFFGTHDKARERGAMDELFLQEIKTFYR